MTTVRSRDGKPSREFSGNVQDTVNALYDEGFIVHTSRNGRGNIEMARYSKPEHIESATFFLYGSLPDEIVEIIP